jgi:hypothetical protein
LLWKKSIFIMLKEKEGAAIIATASVDRIKWFADSS